MSDTETNIDGLKDELLEASVPPKPEEPTKRNTKQALIDKILEVTSREGIPLNHSNTKLKRMSKQQLANLLAEIIEEGMRKKMARQVGVEDSSDSRAIALGALRMLHDVCAMGCEKAGNAFLEPRGYEIDGFSQALKEPTVSQCIDGCLQEIADENQDLLEYVQSPYTRLMIAWGGALAFSCKQKQKNVAHVGPHKPRTKVPLRRRGGGGATPGKKHPGPPPPEANVKQV